MMKNFIFEYATDIQLFFITFLEKKLDFWHPRWFHKNSWFLVKSCPFWKKVELVCSKLNKVHENDNNSFSPKNAFWAIFPESATYTFVWSTEQDFTKWNLGNISSLCNIS